MDDQIERLCLMESIDQSKWQICVCFCCGDIQPKCDKSVMKWCFDWWCLLLSLNKCMLHGIDHQLSETVGQEV
jgi:hypothetical protein